MDELSCMVNIQPWFVVLTEAIGKAVKEAVEAGMPIDTAALIATDALRTALPEAVRVEPVTKRRS